jgi:peptidoglycan/LPS O-acetylase OafA/YrhL
MVVLLHFIGDLQPVNAFERAFTAVGRFGMYGVDLFFLLSGFLITGILIEARDSLRYFRNFYMRRVLRIFPLYYGVLALVFVVAPWVPLFAGPALDAMRDKQAWAWLYGVNVHASIHGALGFGYLNHFWSLAVEEHFYFVWPLIVWLCSRRSLVVVSAVAASASLGARVALARWHPMPVTEYVLTPFRLDALCMGALLAALAKAPDGLGRLSRAAGPSLVILSAVFAISYWFGQSHQVWQEPTHQLRNTLYVGFFGVLLVIGAKGDPKSPVVRALCARPMRFLGRYSYGLYVFHHFPSYYLLKHGTVDVLAEAVGSHTAAMLAQATLGTGVSVGVAMLSYRYFETPFLALKRYWPARSEPGQPSDAAPRVANLDAG